MARDGGSGGDVPPMGVTVAALAAGGDRFKRHNKAGYDAAAYHNRKQPAHWRKYVAAGKQQQQQRQRARQQQQQHRQQAAAAPQQHRQQQQEDACDGWTFWSGIYTDREQSMAAAAAAYNAPPIAAVLSAERVRRSRVLLDRLPWGVSEPQLAALVADTIAPSAHAVAVHCRPVYANASAKAPLATSAMLTFYTPESAMAAVHALDGCTMRGRRVRATLCHGGGVQHGALWADQRYTHAWPSSGTDYGDQLHTMDLPHDTWSTHTAVESAATQAGGKDEVDTWHSSDEISVLRHSPKQVYDTSGTAHLMKMFKQVVLRHGAMLYTDKRLSQLAAQSDRPADTAPLAYDAWPLAFARLCADSAQVPLTMHGPYLCLGHHEHQCRVSRPYTDEWEPMAPSEIVSLLHWCDYVAALVHHMGPVHVHDAVVYHACAHVPHRAALPTHDPWSMCAAAVSAVPDRLMLADGVLHPLRSHHGRVDVEQSAWR